MAFHMFRYSERKYYQFALRVGLANLFRNGFSLGLRKTVGSITQPINSSSRFPEYHFLGESVQAAFRRCSPGGKIAVLDVASPKHFGIYLAYHFAIEACLSDIDVPTMREAEQLWSGVARKARGSAVFSIQDARSLGYPDNTFDVVYSMSVAEHIEGRDGDSVAIREMARVLKPGGTLAVSVPFG